MVTKHRESGFSAGVPDLESFREKLQEMEGYLVKWTYKGPFETPVPGQKPKKKKQLCQNDPGIVTFHRDQQVCAKYYVCQGEVQHHKTCPDGLVFNENENVCDWPSAVEECAHLVAT